MRQPLNNSKSVVHPYSNHGLTIFNQIYQELIKLQKSNDKLVIAINGAPQSGKSTLAHWINYKANLDDISNIIISTDNYMCIPRAQRLAKKISGFDVETYNLKLLETHINTLKNNKLSKKDSIKFPVYNTKNGLELSKGTKVKSNSLIIIEGLMSYSLKDIKLVDVFIWLEMPNEKRIKYRTKIDMIRNYNKMMALVSLDVHERDWPKFKKKQFNVLNSVCDNSMVKKVSWDDVRFNK